MIKMGQCNCPNSNNNKNKDNVHFNCYNESKGSCWGIAWYNFALGFKALLLIFNLIVTVIENEWFKLLFINKNW